MDGPEKGEISAFDEKDSKVLILYNPSMLTALKAYGRMP